MAGCRPQRDEPWVIARREHVPTAGDGNVRPSPVAEHAKPRLIRPSSIGEPFQTVEGRITNGRFGHAVAGAGDVNGDGYADVLVGAFGAGGEAAGEVLLFYGSRSGIGREPSWRFTCPVNGAEFGHQVEGVGDVNGDGFGDFIVGATYYSGPGSPRRTGGAFLFLGGKNGPGSQPNWEMTGEEPNSSTGFAVAAAGDVNGDGYADVLIGAWNQSNPGPDPTRGRVALYLGGAGGLARQPVWSPHGEQMDSSYGYTLHGIGDVNGDGFADVAVGAWGYEAEQARSGRVYVYYGSRNGPSTDPDWTITATRANSLLGNSVFGAGDVNGDGYDDLLIAANCISHPEENEGLALVVHGGPGGLESTAAWSFEANQPFFFLGHSVATAGDLNSDGFADIVVSAFNGRQHTIDEGVTFVFHGSKGGLPRLPDWTFCGGQSRGGYGSTVRCAGDVDADGYDDLVVGQTYFSEAIPRQGRAWVHFGSANGLAANSHWSVGLEAVGFTYRNVTLPWPNTLWVTLSAGMAGLALVLATRFYYRRRERRIVTLQAAREDAQWKERQRLAHDLHDQLGADLTEMVLASGRAKQESAGGQPTEAKLSQLETTATRLVASLAEVVWLTKPTNDNLQRLADYLGNLAVESLERAGFRCELSIPEQLPDWPVRFDQRHDVVLAVREVLHNAVKHSGGDLVTLAIRIVGNELKLTVRDNGHGFDPAGIRPAGNGLNNLEFRMARHGGKVRWNSSATGTEVVLTVPLPNRESHSV